MVSGPSAELTLRYLGGCPGRTRPETVRVVVYANRFEVRARGWGWRIGFESVISVGGLRPAAGGGMVVPVEWTPPAAPPLTLLLAGSDAARLRFLLAQAVATARLTTGQGENVPDAPSAGLAKGHGAAAPAGGVPNDAPDAPFSAPAADTPGRHPPPPPRVRRLPAGAWARELRRMRAITAGALVGVLVALAGVFAVAVLVLRRESSDGHWARDRAILAAHAEEVRLARERNDAGAFARALQALVDECQRVELYNGEVVNTGADFLEAQRICATAGIVLF